MVVRSCALDSGTLTVDTEIVRMSHCGGFYFEERYVRGCLQSCFEDACNAAPLMRTKGAVSNFLCFFPWIWMVVSLRASSAVPEP